MKALFLGLCLLNLVFFFWKFHQGALNSPDQTQTQLPTIWLVDEMERARRGAAISAFLDQETAKLLRIHTERAVDRPVARLPATKPSPTKSVPKSRPLVCHEIGPFGSQSAASAWLADNALRGEFFQQDVQVPSAYLVYLPSAKTPEQTRIQKMMLNAKGITDIWVIPSGELKDALSLGLFNDQMRAVLFRNQLLQRGVQAEIKERYKSESRLFVRLKGDHKQPKRLAEGITVTNCKITSQR